MPRNTQRTSLAMLGVSHPHSSARFRSARGLGGDVVGAWDPDHAVLTAFCAEVGAVGASLDDLLASDVEGVLVHSKSKDMVALSEQALDAGVELSGAVLGATGLPLPVLAPAQGFLLHLVAA